MGGWSTDAAYLYDTNSGELLKRFTDPDPSLNNTFGFSVAIFGDQALIGARGSSHPKAYLYEIESGSYKAAGGGAADLHPLAQPNRPTKN